MMKSTERKVEEFIREHGMIGMGDVVIAGVSGGADSVCLLFVLCALKEKMGFQLQACHVNHGLRGADADADEAYVRELCGELGVPCRFFHEDVESFAKKWKQSLEEAGREVRRNAFETMCRENSGTKIATAHHQGDNAETIIWNMARGTGLKGLRGILPVDGIRIRPLLALTREETEGYLHARGFCWCEDSTNAQDHYTRNRIRHNILPMLETQVNQGTPRHLEEMSQQVREVWDYLELGTDRAWERCVREQGRETADKKAAGGRELERRNVSSLYIDGDKFREEMPAVQKQLLRRGLALIRGKEQDIGAVHVTALAELFAKQTGRSLDLPGPVTAKRVYGGVVLSREKERKSAGGGEIESMKEAAPAVEVPLAFPGTVVFPATGQRITCRFMENVDLNRAKEFPQKSYTKWIDYDIIKYSLSARTRQEGDYFTVDEKGSRQKLKSFFINEKIPQEDRKKMLLIADGKHIVWIPGRRMSRSYHISSTTKRILEINITEE